ncbi:TIGR03621 family F420-dependent LLM class oxidoreductase [Nocardiopsis suaedae]|uniref:TIGR03621 family F420-dependent LLM class oxidoreductase n=1 Tax=Nocardiopsis suaedae TaxID=3018444 RepID=A0ABT4TUL6_9ACTN|nr:TIGR03621 family F420-dependent LLM class oxidoreductase [Nocardiopsis suaedae]MDA2807919.1 TIGR03621 family F420-dependent LLM class oxidoreductase [Nocardiopsis suaedae]
MNRFRFGVNFRAADIGDWAEESRRTEAMGYDTLVAPDHLGHPSPFGMLAAAAAATERARLGTLVLNNEFWNPALLAREAATVDRLSGGRLELGLGLGHMKAEFEAAGIPWRGHAERLAALESSLDALDGLFAGQEPQPVQKPRPPLLIGGHGAATLRLAARRADIIGFGGLRQRRGARMGVFDIDGPAEVLRRVELVREEAGERAAELEFNVLVQAVVVTGDAEREAARLAERYAGGGGLDTAADVLASPFVLVGTVDEIAAELLAARERYGFSYVTVHGESREEMARVIPRVRELAGE